VWVKLAESDYAAVRKFEGRGSLRAFLAVVLNRYLLDYRVQKWGRWRPSARARELGAEAIELEFLIQRKGYNASEAVRTLTIEKGCRLGEDDLQKIVAQLPLRRKDFTSAEDWLERIPCSRPTPEGVLREEEIHDARSRLEDSLERVLARLNDEDRLALKMRFEQGLKLNEMARALGHDPKRFYRQFERILNRLKRLLKDDGVDVGQLDFAFSETEWGRSY
jgi:RNA polymerase sigma factor (sigma-70 family)